ncbi:MAG: glycosyltransferase [Candidatus Hydrogenedentota bacterium]
MSVNTAWFILEIASIMVLMYFLLLNATYGITSIIAFAALRSHARKIRTLGVEELATIAGVPPVTLVAPAYNEEKTCVDSVNAFLTLRYPDFEVLVVNDGSRDKTLAVLKDAYQLVPSTRLPTASIATKNVRAVYHSRLHSNLWVIDKENGGKSDALNVGINFCRTTLFCAMDADTLLERDALLRIVRPFLEDRRTVVTGGIIRIANGCRITAGEIDSVALPRGMLARYQVVEYLRAFLSGRIGWNALNGTLIVSGAFGLLKRSMVVEVGGYDTTTVGEDMELVVRIHRHCLENAIPYRITFVPDPVAWTECPENFMVLMRQRDRWQRGLMQALTMHRRMLLNPRYGAIGMLAFPYFYFLEMMGPVIEVVGYLLLTISLATGSLTSGFSWAFLFLAIIMGIVLSISAVGLGELSLRRYPNPKDLALLFAVSLTENFGYRQIITIFRMMGTMSALRKKKGWGHMVRRGFRPA